MIVVAAGWSLFNPLLAATDPLNDIVRVSSDGISASSKKDRSDSAAAVEVQLNRFCNPLKAKGNIVTKLTLPLAVAKAGVKGTAASIAFEQALTLARIETIKSVATNIASQSENSLDSTTAEGQTNMKAQTGQKLSMEAAASLVGLTVIRSLVGVNENQQPAIGICTLSSNQLRDSIPKLVRQGEDARLQPTSPSPVEVVETLSPEEVSTIFGIRLLSDSTGRPLVLAFAQAPVNYGGTSEAIRAKFRDNAAAAATGLADTAIGEYLGGAAQFSDEQMTEQLVEIALSDDAESEKVAALSKMNSRLTSQVRLNLSGLSTVRRWSLPATKTAPEIVGVVRIWQPSP